MAREVMVTLFPETQAFAERRPEARAALSVSHLTKRFGDELVLDDVSFSVDEGESLVLLGPSGSGKSTTLRLIAGLESPDSGQVVIGGKRVDEVSARARNVGVIFQHYALFPGMTVAENIGFGLKIRRVKAKQRQPVIDRLLDLIGLADQREKYPWQISGGQAQRVAIARALAYEPEVLLFDESFSALDPQTRVPLRREIRALLRKLRVPALFITHDQEEAMELGDHVAILNRGRLEQIGSPSEIYNDPQTEFVATFLGAANVLEGKWQDGLIHLDSDRYLAPVSSVPPLTDGERVKVIFRPEDVSLGSATGLIETPYHLGRGEITDVGFTGASETLTVRLLTYGQSGNLLVPRAETGRNGLSSLNNNAPAEFVIKALRTKWEARKLRLRVGDRVTVGLKAYKALRA
ncbi:MAG TPA: ABC transporter ATP-binding protein [Blastocatellia bacterium]|nr:ABC transporter ATP-binding protein [Blastocatellia bacterium]